MPKAPTKPALWNAIKKKARASSAGSPPGRWSARKSALARREYEKRGGKWEATNQPAPKAKD